MAGWHHRLDAHGFGWTPGVDDGQGDLLCCDSWGCKESDTTEWLNWTELISYFGRLTKFSEAPSKSYFKNTNWIFQISRRASLAAQLVKNLLQCRRPRFDSWFRKICWRMDRLPTPVFLGFPCGSAGKESACNAWDLGLISGLGRSPGKGKGYPLQYSGLENSMDCIVHGVTKSRTRLSNFQFLTIN